MQLLLKQCKLITSCFCSPVNQIKTGASSDYCRHNGCLGDGPQLSLSMDQEVWRGERGGCISTLHPVSTKRVHRVWASEHQTLKFNPQRPRPAPSHLICPPLAEIVIRANYIDLEVGRRFLIKISVIPSGSSGLILQEPPLVFIVMEMMLFANWLLHLPGATFPTISLTRRVSPGIHSFEFRTFYGLPVVSVHMKDLKQHDTARKGQPKYVKVFLNASPN